MNVSQFNTNAEEVLETLTAGSKLNQSDVVFSGVSKNPEDAGNRTRQGELAFDAAHETVLRGPHYLASQLQSYTDWLNQIHHSGSPGSGQIGPEPTVQTPFTGLSNSGESRADDCDLSRPPETTGQDATLTAGRTVESLAHPSPVKIRPASVYSGTGTQKIRPALAAWETETLLWPREFVELIQSSRNSIDQLAGLILRQTLKGRQRVVFSGMARNCGTTLLMAAVGRALLARGKRVLLVDADIEDPGLSNRLRLNELISWLDSAQLKREPSHYLVREMKSDLYLMPVASVTDRANWPRCTLDVLVPLIQQLKRHFDTILIDVGPGKQLFRELGQSDALVDAAVLVHNSRRFMQASFDHFQSGVEDFGVDQIIVADHITVSNAV